MHRELAAKWQPGLERQRARPGCVDIWRLDLVELARQLTQSGRQPPGPRTHTGPNRSGMRAAAHHARRQILGRYLDREADSLVFGLHPGGKPLLEGPDQRLGFNLSHSRGVGLLAVTVGAHVGIDIEIERDINDQLRIARSMMTRAEVDVLAGGGVGALRMT